MIILIIIVIIIIKASLIHNYGFFFLLTIYSVMTFTRISKIIKKFPFTFIFLPNQSPTISKPIFISFNN